MFPNYRSRLLLQAACRPVVVINALSGGVAAARVERVRLKVERRVLVLHHLILCPSAVPPATNFEGNEGRKEDQEVQERAATNDAGISSSTVMTSTPAEGPCGRVILLGCTGGDFPPEIEPCCSLLYTYHRCILASVLLQGQCTNCVGSSPRRRQRSCAPLAENVVIDGSKKHVE